MTMTRDEDIRALVERLLAECREHDSDYHHQTPPDVIADAEKVLAALLAAFPEPTAPTGKYRDQCLQAAYDLAHADAHCEDGSMAFLDVVDRIMEEIDAKQEADLAASRVTSTPEPTAPPAPPASQRTESPCEPHQEQADHLMLDTILDLLAANKPEGLNWPGVARLVRRMIDPPKLVDQSPSVSKLRELIMKVYFADGISGTYCAEMLAALLAAERAQEQS